jgi:hypothetical protein
VPLKGGLAKGTARFDGAPKMGRVHRLAVALLLLALPLGGVAHAGEKSTCVAAYKQAQIRRKAGALRDAREQLLVCSRAICPTIVKADCVPWLGEVTGAIASIVVDARDATGAPLRDVTVRVDGEVRASTLDGRPIDMDPGPHTLRFEAAGLAPVEQSVALKAGERERPIRVAFAPHAEPATPPLAASARRPVPTSVIALGVGTVVLGAGFAIFGALGNSKKSDLDAAMCKPGCPSADVATVERDYVIADAALGAGLVTLAVGVYLYATRPTLAAEVTSFGVHPTPGGVVVSRVFSF